MATNEALFTLTARIRRAMPRNDDILDLCQRAEALGIAASKLGKLPTVAPVSMAGGIAPEPDNVPGQSAPGGQKATVLGTECPVCAARKAIDAAKKKAARKAKKAKAAP